ncbi:hypothetical protein [Blastococcus xanthinilyticus]|uniref:Uncharacterized protein n=1 Tax=Blastococcus xanthinilyticus TaxID=1564164 RepID=A0A5S5D6R9_9ACTN|nr:hypothetical protein [Blastococcus xanthinilyticus]TYP90746.1 hypothetical protein BD833_101464 [Blastococcus xanthinilyticus]
MQPNTVRTRLRTALRQLLVDDWTLFTSWAAGRPVSEVSICAHLGWHLRPQFPRSWDVDCEYNRAGDDAVKRGAGGETLRADLLVHRRGRTGPGNNLLVLELKVTEASAGTGGSFDSVRSLARAHRYQHGVYLTLGARRDGDDVRLAPRWQWVHGGEVAPQQDVFGSAALEAIRQESFLEADVRARYAAPDK